jgi:hypothetical protein
MLFSPFRPNRDAHGWLGLELDAAANAANAECLAE